MKAVVNVFLKKNILDPQGVTITKSLNSMGYEKIKDIRMGKRFELELDTDDIEEAKKMVNEAADKLLANPVTEDFEAEFK